jgi:hypothetical protein
LASAPGLPRGERAARVVLAIVVGALCLLALALDLPTLSGGQFWNDGATYYSMAWSLARDGDLKFRAEDLARVKKEYPAGPQGIFLKRMSDRVRLDPRFPWVRLEPDQERTRPIFFAKPFVYPLVAAPFVRVFGTRGLLLTNALSFSLALVLIYRELLKGTGPLRALALSFVLVGATVTPLYIFWFTPEILYLALATGGLVAWREKRPLLSAALLGIATYAKPPNVFLALPLLIEPFFEWTRPAWGRLRESASRGAILALCALSLYGLNMVITGDWNYQGGERKTFYSCFPFESPRVTFGNCGFWMTTEHIGPPVQGELEGGAHRGAIARSTAEIHDSFLRNLGYFWIGRFGGAVPYFFPVVLVVAFYLVLGPREPAGLLAVASLIASFLFYIWLIPDNWYGGGGTVGNRYFVNLLPLAIALVPRGREAVLVVAGGLVGCLFVGPILVHPLRHSLRPGLHATREPFLSFPAELTMLNDLSVFTEAWRKKQPFGDTEGHHGSPADPRAYYLYFLDNGTYGRETAFGVQGFWIREGAQAEVVLRSLERVRRLRTVVNGGPGGCRMGLRVGGHAATILAGEKEIGAATLDPGAPYVYYDSFVYDLKFQSQPGQLPSSGDGDPRPRGGFVHLSLDVEAR